MAKEDEVETRYLHTHVIKLLPTELYKNHELMSGYSITIGYLENPSDLLKPTTIMGFAITEKDREFYTSNYFTFTRYTSGRIVLSPEPKKS